MSILQGSGYPATVTPASGVATGYAGVLTVTDPTGAVTTPAVTTGATLTATVPAAVVGNYLLVWSLTKAGQPTEVIQDQFTCEAPALELVSLYKLKQDLNRKASDTVKDEKLRQWIREVQSVIENICGPIVPQTKVYVVDGGNTFFVLPDRWVKSITTLVENIGGTNYPLTEQPLGSSTDNYGYTWERSINKIVRRDGSGGALRFYDGDSNVICTYVAGLTLVPDAIQRAAVRIIAHWYKKADQSFVSPFPAGQNDTDDTVTVGNFEIPYEAMELLEAWRRPPGIF